MRRVNTREIQKQTRLVRERLLAGETLAWVVGEQTVAYITPVSESGPAKPWPDIRARLKSIYGDEEDGESAASIIYEDREPI